MADSFVVYAHLRTIIEVFIINANLRIEVLYYDNGYKAIFINKMDLIKLTPLGFLYKNFVYTSASGVKLGN